ncbi:Hok/Gef family protein [Erwinia sp. E_sp_B01_9]|uniref:Hok/Gef family protein n=1 Tax=unclassified Erwinia TaxID=2622719 RepID=UPI003D9B53DF
MLIKVRLLFHLNNVKVAFYLLKSNGERRPKVAQKMFALCLIVVCITLITVIWTTRDSLCELRFKQGGTEVAASLACNSIR